MNTPPEVDAHAVIRELQQLVAAQALDLAVARAMLATQTVQGDSQPKGDNGR